MVPSKLVCARNLCPSGKWPYVDSYDNPKCVYHKDDGALSEVYGRVLCPFIEPSTRTIRSVVRIPKQTCGRRRMWKYGRCTKMF